MLHFPVPGFLRTMPAKEYPAHRVFRPKEPVRQRRFYRNTFPLVKTQHNLRNFGVTPSLSIGLQFVSFGKKGRRFSGKACDPTVETNMCKMILHLTVNILNHLNFLTSRFLQPSFIFSSPIFFTNAFIRLSSPFSTENTCRLAFRGGSFLRAFFCLILPPIKLP